MKLPPYPALQLPVVHQAVVVHQVVVVQAVVAQVQQPVAVNLQLLLHLRLQPLRLRQDLDF